MKILVVVHDYLPLHIAGTELHAHQTASLLAQRGHGVTALFTERDLGAEEGSLRTGELDGVRTLEMVHQREYADLGESWRQELSARVFAEVLAAERPDVVHFHHLAFWGSACLAAAKASGARTVLTLHDYWALCDAAVLLREDGSLCEDGARGECADCLRRHPLLPERWGAQAGDDPVPLYERAARERFETHQGHVRLADTVIAPSQFLAELFVGAGFVERERVRVMKAGYPGARTAPRPSDPQEPLRVGYVGGIYASKGVHVLVEAMGKLRGEPVELHLHGVLDWFPDYVDGLRRAAEQLPVHFHGRFDPKAVDRVLDGLDLLCVPSLWYENMPITIQEAFRRSIPVVATDLGGMAEAVADGRSGLLFPRGDAGALAECLGRLARDREELARLARGVPHVPTLDEVVDGLERVYRGEG